MTSELTDTLLGLRWPLPRTDTDARAALEQLAQVSGRLTGLADQYQAAAPSWLGQVKALIAQGGFTLDWWLPLLAEPDLDWTVNHQAHLAADLAQIAAAGARILDQLSPSDSAIPPPPVVKSVASFGSVPMSAAAIPPVVPSAPPPPPRTTPQPAPTGAPLLQSGVPGLAPRQGGQPRSGQSGPGQTGTGQAGTAQSGPKQPGLGKPGPGKPGPGPSVPDQSVPGPRRPVRTPAAEPDQDSDELADSGRHRRAAYEFGPPRSTWRNTVQDRLPSNSPSYSDDDDDDDPMLTPGRRLPVHSGMLLQAAAVVCVVGLLSWWAVTELHKPPTVPVAGGRPSLHPSVPGASPTMADGLGPITSGTETPESAPTTLAVGGIAPGNVTVSALNISLEGGSQAVQQVDAYVTFHASSTGAITLTIQYYGTSDGNKTPVQTALFPESGHTSYEIPVVISSGAYCGKTVTVIATAGGVSARGNTQSGC